MHYCWQVKLKCNNNFMQKFNFGKFEKQFKKITIHSGTDKVL